ncbi:unnamed protein product [Rotaria socialis]|uniref:Uncharacterized protein n=1 Tax=Rotaria socialis TaxID=392032 RepID=A0A817Y804_9BILA|nr:unnamed protein product [Rotaria socialis]CAF3321244.1 unnamed protein product [Rotaria socialis]CAF3375267.1 unnamed protein product [Rotaria socialis]CAF4172931.1 unnamed protein product [Rotaria socialis]CAF4406246.1 unnamed protein product [Rotaria socialis]
MQLSSSVRDRSFYANFYCRHPSEIEIIDKFPPIIPSSSSASSPSYALRISSEIPTATTPLSDVCLSAASGFFSSSECSSSESTGSYTKRRRTTAPVIQERLNTYESARIRPSLPLSSVTLSKQKIQSISAVSTPSLVNSIAPQQIPAEQTTSFLTNTTNLIDNDASKPLITNEANSSSLNTSINEKLIPLGSCKKILSKSTSQLCDRLLNDVKEEQVSASSKSILDVIQDELSEIRRADHDLKSMFLSIYSKIQTIQQLKSTPVHQPKVQRYHYHHNERPARLMTHCCFSSNSDIRRISCTHHHNRKYALHTVAALRNQMNNSRLSSTADNDSYVDTDSLSSASDSGACSSPVDNGPCGDD